jgi:SAM-dependent methyltransferase
MTAVDSCASMDEAVLLLRGDPRFAALVRDAYLGSDVVESANRFASSSEFREVRRLVGDRAAGAILDVGAGRGIASFAFAEAGAAVVFALEPSGSTLVGRGAIEKLPSRSRVRVLDGYAEAIPLEDSSVDVVYARQVLHHTSDLRLAVAECARVLRHGGVFLACREHVVSSERDLRLFLDIHPVQRLAGGENAFPLDAYVSAINSSGLGLELVLGPCDSLINAHPEVTTSQALDEVPQRWLRSHLGGPLGHVAIAIPGVETLIRRRLNQPRAGRLYTFLARKFRESM